MTKKLLDIYEKVFEVSLRGDEGLSDYVDVMTKDLSNEELKELLDYIFEKQKTYEKELEKLKDKRKKMLN